jgi:hypothetical protein
MKVLNLHKLFKENSNCLARELDCEVVENFDNIENNETVYIFGGHTNPMDLMKKQIRYKLKYIIIQTENINSNVFTKNYEYLNLLSGSEVWDWSYYNQNYLQNKYKLNITKIYDFEFEKIDSDIILNSKRNIDIFFCGLENKYRKEILENIKKTYPSLKCLFSLNYSLTDPEQLTKILLRSKYVLNLPYYNPSVLATHRINKALSCGCKVISEYSCDDKLDKSYKDKIILTDNVVKSIGQEFKFEYPDNQL